ncbi:MAG: hypothetical protein VYD99_08240, partial [Planctomycetota bacterium]|nr:hypothetical protein [Planctomycetota bacterium]
MPPIGVEHRIGFFVLGRIRFFGRVVVSILGRLRGRLLEANADQFGSVIWNHRRTHRTGESIPLEGKGQLDRHPHEAPAQHAGHGGSVERTGERQRHALQFRLEGEEIIGVEHKGGDFTIRVIFGIAHLPFT